MAAEESEDVIDVESFDEKEGSFLQEDEGAAAVLFTAKQKSEDGIKSQVWNKLGVSFSDWPVDDMDEESYLTIASMLREERQYLGCSDGLSQKRCKKKHPRWTLQERQQFEKATMKYGNSWTKIAKLIPSKTPLQIRNYARYYLPRKAKHSSNPITSANQQDAGNTLHPHVPASLNTASPTVTTALKRHTMHRFPHSTKHSHFKKFGFANPSSFHLKRKPQSGKDFSGPWKMLSKCSRKRITLQGQKALKIGKIRKPKRRGGGKLSIRCKKRTMHMPCDVISEELEDAMESKADVLFEQEGGVVRMQPESSGDEDVDVEHAGIEEGGKCSDRSLIGLAFTCDRIYSNLIAPSRNSVQCASSKRRTANSKQKVKSTRNKSKVKESKVEIVIPELAWNEDHTYSMSFRTQHRLGVWTGHGANSLKRQEKALPGRDSTRGLKSRSRPDDLLVFIDSKESMSESDVSIPECNSPKESSDDFRHEEDKVCVDSEKDFSEHELVIDLEESVKCNIKNEQPALKCDFTSFSDERKKEIVMDHDTEIVSSEKDVISDTPLLQNKEVENLYILDNIRTEQLQAKDSKEGCSISEELNSPEFVETPIKESETIQETKAEVEAEMAGVVHCDEYRGAAVDEEKREADVSDSEDQEIGNLTHENHLNLDKIHSWEKLATPEFFEGSTAKTPGRYLKIRNYIYQQWLQTKPNYLNKASVRSGLKSCGDVNAIGRIHHSLEKAGAINFGVDNPNKTAITCRANAVQQRIDTGGNHDNQHKIRESKRLPKKKDVDKKPQFNQKTEEKAPLRKSVRTGPRRSRLIPYDPFKLIECGKFTEEKRAPFHVRIQSDAMIIMDVHAHLSITEVIGLLGGRYLSDSATLDVLLAVPCNSISTGMQCEMDPVSQTEAYESILAKGYQVVGWYHSHPAFPANPSVRDIETQSEFQGWFSQGGAPFIGVIISPCHNYQISQSKVCCLTIREWSPELKCRKPYKFDFAVSHSHCDNVHTMKTIVSLVTKFAAYQFRTEMLYLWSKHYDFTFLEKMLRSIRTYMSPSQQGNLLKRIKDFITAEFTSETITRMKEVPDK